MQPASWFHAADEYVRIIVYVVIRLVLSPRTDTQLEELLAERRGFIRPTAAGPAFAVAGLVPPSMDLAANQTLRSLMAVRPAQPSTDAKARKAKAAS